MPCLCLLALGLGAGAQSLSGTYSLNTEGGVATLRLTESGDGIVTGTISLGDITARFSGRKQGGKVTGSLASPESEAKGTFTIVRRGASIEFAYKMLGADADDARTMVFTTPGKAAPPGKTPAPVRSAKGVPATRPASGGSGGTVRINGETIPPAELDRLARKYGGQRIPPGNYWYDRRCGAWGKAGGPTLGFTAAGLSLGGKLRAVASGGNTGVFINGREIHLIDVIGFQKLGIPVARGRWWVDAQFNFGQDGSSIVLGNLLQIAKQANSKAYGGSYSGKTGVSTASDGEGGFMATVPDGHGGSIGWYSGK